MILDLVFRIFIYKNRPRQKCVDKVSKRNFQLCSITWIPILSVQKIPRFYDYHRYSSNIKTVVTVCLSSLSFLFRIVICVKNLFQWILRTQITWITTPWLIMLDFFSIRYSKLWKILFLAREQFFNIFRKFTLQDDYFGAVYYLLGRCIR